MFGLHGAVDRINGWIISLRDQAPVSWHPCDLMEFESAEPWGIHTPPAPAALNVEADVWDDRITFHSPAPSGDARNDMVHAVRWRCGPRPSTCAALMLHGGFATSFAAEKLIAKPFLNAGVDVVALCLPYHMQRSPEEAAYSGQYLLSGDIPRLVRGFAQAAQDAAALTFSLRNHGYTRLFAGGISLGGNVAAQLAILAKLDFLYMLIPAVDPFETLWKTPIGAGIFRAARAQGIADSTVEAAMRLITPRLLGAPKTQPERIRIVLGEYDVMCPPKPIEALARAWSVQDIERLSCGHRTFAFHLSGVVQRLVETTQRSQSIKGPRRDR